MKAQFSFSRCHVSQAALELLGQGDPPPSPAQVPPHPTRNVVLRRKMERSPKII